MTETSSRLLSLLTLLQTPRDWSGPLLAERLTVSERTVRRDVERLRDLGYRIHVAKGPGGGYRLDAGTALPPLLFDDDQAVALAVALQTVAASGADLGDAAQRALATVRQVLPSRLRHRVDGLPVTTIGRTPPGDEVVTGVLLAVAAAVRAHEVLRFDYDDGRPAADGGEDGDENPGEPRRAEPHHLVARDGRWYLVAWDLDRDDWRTFRLDRLTPRVPHGPRFAPRELPGGDVGAFVTARFRGAPAARPGGATWPCVGEVVLALPEGDVAPFVEQGAVTALGRGRCRVVLGSWSWPALAAAFGRFDADVEVVGPPQLAAAFRRLGRRFLAAEGAT